MLVAGPRLMDFYGLGLIGSIIVLGLPWAFGYWTFMYINCGLRRAGLYLVGFVLDFIVGPFLINFGCWAKTIGLLLKITIVGFLGLRL
jgi:hypothetical protein